MMKKIASFLLCVCVFGCGGGGGGGGNQEAIFDVTGRYRSENVVCVDSLGNTVPLSGTTFRIEQAGRNVTVIFESDGSRLNGTLDGSGIEVDGDQIVLELVCTNSAEGTFFSDDTGSFNQNITCVEPATGISSSIFCTGQFVRL